jgi:4-diphosphocytidyl-2-C-methyl-D-erythritol kinase
VPARAKINLFLAVLGLRRDGFHEVRTLMHTVSLADSVGIAVTLDGVPASGGVDVRCEGFPQLDGSANLAHRAASSFLDAARHLWPDGSPLPRITITIRKRIPIAAGLAGGSSNAAATLLGLRELLAPLLKAPLMRSRLMDLAAGLGSDVPFCLDGGAGWGTGRGDKISQVPSTLGSPVLIAVPPFGVSSRDAYAWWDEDNNPGGRKIDGHCPACVQNPPAALASLCEVGNIISLIRNDLRASVARRHPVIGDLMSAMEASGALAAEMSGSGPAVYGLFRDEAQARGAGDCLKGRFDGLTVHACRFDPARMQPEWVQQEPPNGGTN